MGFFSLSKEQIVPISYKAGSLMTDLFKTLKEVIQNTKNYSSSKSLKDEEYLAKSTDLCDLERRQKEIDSRFTRKL